MVTSLLEAREYHLADCRFRNLSGKTLKAYAWAWDTFIGWCKDAGEPLTLVSLNPANVKACAVAIRQRVQHGKRGNESAALAFTVNIKVGAKFLSDEDITEWDRLEKVRRPKVATGARRIFTAAERRAIRLALQENRMGARDAAMFELSLYTGLRIGELCALTVQDVEMGTLQVRVRRGKGGRERIVPFGTDGRGGGPAARCLRQWLAVRRPAKKTDALWLSFDGYPFTDKGWRTTFKKAVAECGMPDRVPHETRHTFATLFLVRHWQEQGAVDRLRYLLGHLSDDEYRTYTAEAGKMIADAIGREDIYEESPRRPAAPVPLRRRSA